MKDRTSYGRLCHRAVPELHHLWRRLLDEGPEELADQIEAVFIELGSLRIRNQHLRRKLGVLSDSLLGKARNIEQLLAAEAGQPLAQPPVLLHTKERQREAG